MTLLGRKFAGMTASLDMVHSYVEEEDDGESALSKAEIREVRPAALALSNY